MLAQELRESFSAAGIDVVGVGRPVMDLCNPDTVRNALLHQTPSFVINAAGYTDVDQAESNPDVAFSVNRDGVQTLTKESHRLDIPLVHVSTDYVFDGKSRRPYREDDPVSPLGVYGRSKWEGEECVRHHQPKHIILRTAWLYSVWGRNFLKTVLRKAMNGEELRIVQDQTGSPTWARDLASAIVIVTKAILDGHHEPWGTYHLCGGGHTTWYGFAKAAVEQAKQVSSFSNKPIVPIMSDDYPAVVKRPAYSVLDSSKIQRVFGIQALPWEDRVHYCIKELMACPDLLRVPSS